MKDPTFRFTLIFVGYLMLITLIVYLLVPEDTFEIVQDDPIDSSTHQIFTVTGEVEIDSATLRWLMRYTLTDSGDYIIELVPDDSVGWHPKRRYFSSP